MRRPLRAPCLLLLATHLAAQGNVAARQKFGEVFEADFPFHGSTVDARDLGEHFPPGNVTPRGIILRAGPRAFVCFDTDLLRTSAVWVGAEGQPNGVTLVGMAAGSYHVEGRKAEQGHVDLPKPVGHPLAATGIYPGWQRGNFARTDPRTPAPNPHEVGRGPIDPTLGRFERIELVGDGAAVVYRLGPDPNAVRVRESWTASGAARDILVRSLHLKPRRVSWLHAIADYRGLAKEALVVESRRVTVRLASGVVRLALDGGTARTTFEKVLDGVILMRVPAGKESITIRIAMTRSAAKGSAAELDSVLTAARGEAGPTPTPRPRWAKTVETRGIVAAHSAESAAYVVDRIPLPVPNPWRRKVRAAGIDFLPNGDAAVVTYDGDVWLVSGLREDLSALRWRRFAAGLHEPQSLRVIDSDVFVFARTGILRLRDVDGDGEADRYENFCNAFSQTAETREFAMDLDLHPDGSLLIAKGGQQIGSASLHGGTILRIAKDGSGFEVVARGLREPFLGVHPRRGTVTASDQQGHWVPTTPVLEVRAGDDFGFRDPDRHLTDGEHAKRAPEPSRGPLCWIPHAALKSASSQVWAVGSKLGPWNGRLLQLGYYDPSLFVVLSSTPTCGAVVKLPLRFRFPLLDGRIHPEDGSLFVSGFRIWGTESKDVSGLARVRYTGKPVGVPIDVRAYAEGVLLRFDASLDRESATAAGNYVVQRWQYRRTANYGSGHYRPDGQAGQEAMRVTGVHLAADRRAVFLRVDGMRPAMQMAVRFELRRAARPLRGEVFLTVHRVETADLAVLGFSEPAVVSQPSAIVAREKPSPALGARVFATIGCAACHSIDGSTTGKVGPTMKGMFGTLRPLAKGKPVRADEGYLRRSILEPHKQVVAGYQAVMPSYDGVLTDEQVSSLLLFLRALPR